MRLLGNRVVNRIYERGVVDGVVVRATPSSNRLVGCWLGGGRLVGVLGVKGGGEMGISLGVGVRLGEGLGSQGIGSKWLVNWW